MFHHFKLSENVSQLSSYKASSVQFRQLVTQIKCTQMISSIINEFQINQMKNKELGTKNYIYNLSWAYFAFSK